MSNVGLAIITRNPTAPWKRTLRTIAEAKRRGIEVGIALDPRDLEWKDSLLLHSLADTFFFHRAPRDSVMERGQNDLVQRMYSDLILRVDDDEEPSPSLWDDLTSLNPNVAYSVPVLAFRERYLYQPGMSIEVRIFPRLAHRFAGGLNSEMIVDCPIEARPLDIIWHYSLYAPRAERERRAQKLRGMGMPDDFFVRFMWEDHMDEFVDFPEHMEEELPEDSDLMRVGRELLGKGLAVQR